jgi:hypothetical protein
MVKLSMTVLANVVLWEKSTGQDLFHNIVPTTVFMFSIRKNWVFLAIILCEYLPNEINTHGSGSYRNINAQKNGIPKDILSDSETVKLDFSTYYSTCCQSRTSLAFTELKGSASVDAISFL